MAKLNVRFGDDLSGLGLDVLTDNEVVVITDSGSSPTTAPGSLKAIGNTERDEIIGTQSKTTYIFNGKGGNDFLVIPDSTQDNRVKGRAGFDFIRTAGTGNNCASGGADGDTIITGEGSDRLKGGGGDDFLFGNAGEDRLIGGTGEDYLDGGSGTNVLKGGKEADSFVVTDTTAQVLDFLPTFGGKTEDLVIIPKSKLSSTTKLKVGRLDRSKFEIVKRVNTDKQAFRDEIVYESRTGLAHYANPEGELSTLIQIGKGLDTQGLSSKNFEVPDF